MTKAVGMLGMFLNLLGTVSMAFGTLMVLLAVVLLLFATTVDGVEVAFARLPAFVPFAVWCVLLPISLGLVMGLIGTALWRPWGGVVNPRLVAVWAVAVMVLGYYLLAPSISSLVKSVIKAVW